MAFGATRTVAVSLKANVSDYIGKINAAGKATAKMAEETGKHAQAHKAAWEKVGATATVSGLAVVAAVGLAIKSYADFDQQISALRAVTGASAAEMDRLRDSAIAAGAATKFSARDAAEAQTELAKVGIATADILGGGLEGALNLAAAGNIGLAEAATISGQAMKIFKLNGSDVPEIADALAAGANKSAAGVNDLAAALAQGGLLAAQTGLNLEDTVGTLSLFADNALIGSDAGTSFKTMLTRLNPSTDAAASEMRKLGLDFFDAQGAFVGIEQVAGQLQTKLGKLSDEQRQSALNTIFGTDAIRAAAILYDRGAAGVKTYTDAVSDQGIAARQAQIMMDNLNGDLEQLRGSIETSLIRAGSAGNDVMRGLVQTATSAVNAFGDLPEPVQAVGLGLAAISGGGLLAAGAFLSLVPRIVETKNAFRELQSTTALSKVNIGAIAGIMTGPWGLAIAAGAVAVGAFAKSQLDAKARADELRASLDQQTGAITDNTKAMVAKELQEAGVFKTARDLGIGLDVVTNAALNQGSSFKELQDMQKDLRGQAAGLSSDLLKQEGAFGENGTALTEFTSGTRKSFAATDEQRNKLQGLLNTISPINAALGGQTEQQREIAEATGSAADAVGGLSAAEYDAAGAAGDLQKAHDEMVKAIKAGNDILFGARDATRGYYDALDAAKGRVQKLGELEKDLSKAKTADERERIRKEMEKFALTLDVTTEAGRGNEAALDAVAKSALGMAVENFQAGKSIQEVTKKVDTARGDFVDLATKFGMSKSAAGRLADQLGLTREKVAQLAGEVQRTPDGKTITIKVLGIDPAVNGIGRIRTSIQDLDGKTITISTRFVTTGRLPNGGKNLAGGLTFDDPSDPIHKATGGPIYGPGTGTSDSIPAWLSTGEYVIKAAAVAKYGVHMFDRLNTMRFATGGHVGPQQVSSSHTETNSAPVYIGTVSGPSLSDIEQEAERRRRLQALGRRRSR